MVEQVNIDPNYSEQQAPEQFSIAPAELPPPINEDHAAEKVVKAKIGLPTFPQDHGEMFKNILDGREDQLRKQASAMVDFQTSLRKQQVFNDIAQSQTKPFTPIEADTIKQFLNVKQTEPNTVFEEFYAKNYMENLRKAARDNPDSYLNEAIAQHPEAFEKGIDIGVDLKAKKEFFLNLRAKVEAVSQGRGTVKTVLDFLKYAIPGYNEYNLRGVMGDYKSLLGTNLDREATETYKLPFEEAAKRASFIVDSLLTGKLGGNPYLAATYLQHLTDPSYTNTIMDNTFSAMDFGSLAAKPVALINRRLLNTNLKTAIKQVVESEELPSNRFSIERVFQPEKAFDPMSASTTSYMADLVERLETTSQKLDLKPAFAPERAFESKSAASVSFMQDMTKRIETAVNEATGNLPEAAIASAAREINSVLSNTPSPFDPIRGLQSSFNQRLMDIKGDTRGFSEELVNRVMDGIQTTGNKLAAAVNNTIKVERIPALMALTKNMTAYIEKIRAENPGISNSLMNIKLRRDNATGAIMADWYIGKDRITLFGTERTARSFLIHAGLKDAATIEQRASGFYIKVSKPVDETQPLIRSMLHTIEGTRTPDSWLNAYGGFMGSSRSPEDTLARENLMNRKAATYGPSVLLKLAKDTADEIKQLRGWSLPGSARRVKWNEWKLVMDEVRKVRDPVTGEREGFKTIGDLADFYQNTVHRLPDEQEVAAAFAFQNQGAIVKELENLQARSAKLRVGAETHTIYTLNPDLQKPRSVPSTGVKVDGTIIRGDIPRDGESVLIVGKTLGKERVANINNLGKGKYEEKLLDDLKNGRRTLIRLTNPEERKLADKFNIGNSRPKYVISDLVDSKPLEWQQVSKHSVPDYDYDHYVAQPIIKYDPVSKLYHYEGDRHVAAFNIRAMGQDVTQKLNKIREFIQSDDIAGARAFHATTTLPQDFEEIHGWFKPGVTKEGLPIPAMLSKEHEIRLIPYNKNVGDLDKNLERTFGDSFRNETKDGFRKTLTHVGDPFTLTNEGTRASPLYKTAQLEYVTPITSMHRALNRVINDSFLNDYKLFSVEHWIQEARDHLNVSDAALEAAPTYFFHNPRWKEGADVKIVNNLMTAQLQIKNFLGIQDKTTTFLHAAAQQLADAMYDKGYKHALVPTWALPSLRDPFSFIRSVAFDAKLGLFALPQLWVQLQTFTNIFGIAGPKNAGAGTGATLLHQWTRFSHDPAVIEHMDSIATRMGFLPGQFKEAHELGTNTGFMNVGREHALRDNIYSNALTGGSTGFLDWGRVAFTEGEKATRIGAWYTAYKEYRDVNPTGAINNAELRKILDRADLLTMNMSRASSSSLHQGLLSIPTQFLTYQLRTAELILGKRLTNVEKARTFGFNALMYGVPVAFGLSGLPIGDFIRRSALEQGYVVGDNYINSLVTEGGLSTLIAAVSGNYYNVGERLGSKGFDQFDPLRSDEPWWKLIGGASGSTLINTVASLDGFTSAMLSAFRDDNKAYKMTVDDFVAPFKEISSVSNTTKFLMALNTAKWVNKKEEYVDDVSKGNAIFMYLSGLSPQEQSDAYAKGLVRAHEKNLQEIALTKFTQEHRRFIREQDSNPEQANQHLKNAFAILRIAGYPEERIPSAVAIANKSYESLINSSNFNFYQVNVPTPRVPAAQQALQDTYNQKR